MSWRVLRNVLVIVWIALSVSACCSSRETAVSRSADLRINESTDLRSRDSVMVAVHDTVMVTKMITITKNVDGDTTFTSVVTERDRVRDRAQVKDREERVVVRTDTVLVEKRDSVLIQKAQGPRARDSPFTMALKWVFWIIVALIALTIVFKIKT